MEICRITTNPIWVYVNLAVRAEIANIFFMCVTLYQATKLVSAGNLASEDTRLLFPLNGVVTK